jgi:putative PIN family toxin of toxin-antitoxin system
MRVVIDTNVLLVIVPSQSKYNSIYQSFKRGDFKILISFDIVLEYEEQLKNRYPTISINEELNNIINSPYAEQVTPNYNWQLISIDPDDNKFVDCAIAAQADYIVTNDRHFDILSQIPFPKVEVITIQQFETILFNQS